MPSCKEIHLKNVDRSPQRLRKFRQRNPHLRNVLRVAGIDGTKVDGSRRDAGHFQKPKAGYRRIHESRSAKFEGNPRLANISTLCRKIGGMRVRVSISFIAA
jgi:hypothetical protein